MKVKMLQDLWDTFYPFSRSKWGGWGPVPGQVCRTRKGKRTKRNIIRWWWCCEEPGGRPWDHGRDGTDCWGWRDSRAYSIYGKVTQWLVSAVLSAFYNWTRIGQSGHILTTIPAGQHIQGYEMIDGDNTQQGDMVMVLQQQLIQMPRSEAYRLGYIHPNSIG